MQPSGSLTPGHQQPWDTHTGRGALSPRGGGVCSPQSHPGPQGGGGVCPLALRTTRPGSSEPPPLPAVPGADLGLWAPGGRRGTSSCQVRLEDTRGGAKREGRTEKRRQTQRERERESGKTDRPTDGHGVGVGRATAAYAVSTLHGPPPRSLSLTETLPARGPRDWRAERPHAGTREPGTRLRPLPCWVLPAPSEQKPPPQSLSTDSSPARPPPSPALAQDPSRSVTQDADGV